jgi:hypothetical protein
MRRFFAVLAAGALVLGACNSDGGVDPSENPKEALIQAFEGLGDEPTTITLSIEADEAGLQEALEDSGDPPPPGVVSTILDSAFVVSANGESGENSKAEFSLDIGGQPMVEATVEAYDLYLRADVPGLMETFGVDPSKLDRQLAQIPPGLEFVEPAAQGEWIHLTGAEQLAGMAGQQQGSEEQQEEATRFFEGLIEEHVTAEEGDEDGPGTHVRTEVALKEAFEDLASFAEESAQGALPAGQLAPLQQIPEGELLVDTWIDDGRLTQLRVDFIENSERFGGDPPPEGVEEFALLVEFDEWDEEVEVPSDAVEVSFEDIFGALMGGAFSGSEGAGGGTTSEDPQDVCEQIAALPPEQQEPFKDICPEL